MNAGAEMRVSALFSGGKDSTYALYVMQQQGWEVASLLTVIPKASDSYMFHYPNIRWTKLHSEALGIPIKQRDSSGLKEEELKDLEELMRSEDTDGFVCGAIASDYQWSRLNEIAQRLGKIITVHSIKELEQLREKYRISVTGEGGELETFVLDGPNFSKEICILEAHSNWKRNSGNYVITRAVLEDKK
ncbi:MAG TPA: hypothetical protein VJ489_00845 [Thermoplasmata archaeon]|nr:hypothetical protein [Thermoplasmata archaeon]